MKNAIESNRIKNKTNKQAKKQTNKQQQQQTHQKQLSFCWLYQSPIRQKCLQKTFLFPPPRTRTRGWFLGGKL